jgi:hypothetical protein
MVSVASCAALLTAAAPAVASSGAGDGSSDATLIAAGRVTGAKGVTGKTAGSIPLTLFAWPSSDVTAAMKVGDQATLQPLAETVSEPDGSFALRLTSLDDLAPVTGDDSIVNFAVVAGESNGEVYRGAFAAGHSERDR